MDVRSTILSALPNAPGFEPPAAWRLTQLQENAYHLSREDSEYFIKWVAQDDELGQAEIVLYREILAQANFPTPRLLDVFPAVGGYVACFEWLPGTDLRTQARHLLPQAFASLARFHAEQRWEGMVLSPTTSARHFHPRMLCCRRSGNCCAGVLTMA